MANSPGLCYSFKTDILNGLHAFGPSVVRGSTTKDNFKGALYYATATITNTGTTTYTNTGEITASGTYALGGQLVTNATAPANVSGTSHWTPSGNLSWTGFTAAAFDTLLMYNNTAAGNNAVGVFTFSSQTINAGTFTLQMPVADQVTGLIRLV
jgi:hypothetical protein